LVVNKVWQEVLSEVPADTLLRELAARQAVRVQAEQDVVQVQSEMLLRILRERVSEARFIEVSAGLTGDDGSALVFVSAMRDAKGERLSAWQRNFNYPNPLTLPLDEISTSRGKQVWISEREASRALAYLLGQAVPTEYDYRGDHGKAYGYYDLQEKQGLDEAEYSRRVVAQVEVVL
jgi:hypothetical protein